jgi:hypothetical protein
MPFPEIRGGQYRPRGSIEFPECLFPHLDRNIECEQKGNRDSIKYFVAVLILVGLLYVVCTRIGLG